MARPFARVVGDRVEDLIQIGTIALIEAARGFEDRGEASFATYATMRVRGAMIDALRKSATMVRSAMRRRREFGIARARSKGSSAAPRPTRRWPSGSKWPSPPTAWPPTATHAVRQESIDDVYSDHSEWFADDAPRRLRRPRATRLKAAVGAAIGALPPREALVLQLYFVEEMNLEEIGLTLDVGAARVCQIKKAALAKVRASARRVERQRAGAVRPTRMQARPLRTTMTSSQWPASRTIAGALRRRERAASRSAPARRNRPR